MTLTKLQAITNGHVSIETIIPFGGIISILVLFSIPVKGKTKKGRNEIHSIHLKNLMELTIQDPDPYFFGAYNWYYTGGVLETVSIADMDFLFFATGEKLNVFSKYNNNSHHEMANQIFPKIKMIFVHRFSHSGIGIEQKPAKNSTFRKYRSNSL